MAKQNPTDVNPERLSQLLGLACDPSASGWNIAELGPILRHQLASRVDVSVLAIYPGGAPELQDLPPDQRPLLRSFELMLHDANPPIALLELTRQYAKACRTHVKSLLPPEVATILYYMAIVTARLKCGQRITKLDDAALRRGLQSILLQEWIDTQTRALLEAGVDAFSSDGHSTEIAGDRP